MLFIFFIVSSAFLSYELISYINERNNRSEDGDKHE